jgi:hypothetical protein
VTDNLNGTIGGQSNKNNSQDIISNLERNLQKAIKKMKNTNKLDQRITLQRDTEKNTIDNSELLDLKSELYSLKNKLVQ